MSVDAAAVRLPSTTRPRTAGTVALAAHALRGFARSPMSAFFTLAFPLSFFLIINTIAGDQIADDHATVRISQFLVAPFAVFGSVEAVFCVLATDLAALRENGVLKRLHGSPVPAWSVLAARIGAAAVVALASVTLLFAVGVAFYDVQIVWRKLPAAVLAVLLGVACFAALGLALVGLTRSVLTAQTVSNGLLIPVAFVSNVFIVGADLPAPLAWVGRVLPLRHYADALAAAFDPVPAGSGFRPADLAVLAAWGLAGGVVAVWRFGWEPRRGGTAATGRTPGRPAPAGARLAVRLRPRPGAPALLATQIRAALITLRRDILAAFFAVAFPVLLLLLFPAVFPDARFEGMPLGTFMVPAMIAYSVAVIAFVNTPSAVAEARQHGVLDRLRSGPAPLWTFYAGRAAATVLIAAAAAVALVTAGVLGTGFELSWSRLPPALLAFTLGVACWSAAGFLLVAALRRRQVITAAALGTLLPLSFISDVFVIGDGGSMPAALRDTADLFPLRHLSRALIQALAPAAGGVAWGHLAVLLGWTLAAGAVALMLRTGSR